MSPYLVAGLILAVYLFLVFVMFKDWIPIVWALVIMGVAILVIAGGRNVADYYKLVNDGMLGVAGAIWIFIFGGVFARSQIETGIVENIIKRAVELGGDRPLITVLLMAAATAYVTTGSFLGGLMLTATITIPIMVTLGIPAVAATTIHVMAATTTLLWWVQQWALLGTITNGTKLEQMVPFLAVYTPIVGVITVAYILFQFKVRGLAMRWTGSGAAAAAAATSRIEKRVPAYALFAPIVPLVLILGFNVPVVVAFMIGVPVAVLLTHPGSGRSWAEVGPLLSRIYVKGLEDMAYVVALMLGIGIVMQAAKFPYVAAPLTETFKVITPSSPILFVLFFGVLLLTATFRGPTMPWGMGAVTFAAIIATGKFPVLAVAALAAAYNQFSYVADPTCAGVVWPCGYAKVQVFDFMKSVFPWMFLIGLVGVILVPIMYGI